MARTQVLHVDDDPAFTELTVDMLERQEDQFTVETAHSASEGLELLAGGGFDCIVSDYDMPGRNGLEFLEVIREQFPDLPFILFTGKGSEEVASDAISAGITDYLQKGGGTERYELLANRIETAVRQYRAERELERQNDLFAKAQDIASVGAWEYNTRTGDSYASEQVLRMHGLDPDDAITPEESIEHVVRENRPVIREAFERALEEGEAYDLRLRLVAEDGTRRWVRTRGEPQSENGEIVRIRGTFQDITEQRRRERELERQNERLEEFAHIVSHDIRAPLQVASEQLDVAEETGEKAAFGQVRTAHDRIESIIDDVLTLAQQGKQIGETEHVSIEQAVGAAWDTIDTSNLTLSSVTDCYVDADPDRLRQLFRDLFSNAAEHGGDEVTLSVGLIEPFPTSTRGAGDASRGFYVADDGSGIPPDERETVFKVGYSTAEDGTGYGLNIVEQIVEAHNWEIAVTESPTGGARFEITGVDLSVE